MRTAVCSIDIHEDVFVLWKICTTAYGFYFTGPTVLKLSGSALIPAIRERIFDLSLLPQSRELIPRNFRPYGWLCLSSDADAVESKLNELEATGDEEALARWKVERRKAVQDRDANAEHFRSWFAARDQERGIELVQQKDAHQVE
ncbi:hypothetical protein BN14_06133 [Rhizoctonia solani AG-1 IB]|uniref:Uncharacterized protein n=1 Tax=Thanatephorus cucumeris (strain AG1-IB / isolate 7/3/14) TaxID=1108050 RepID=M5BZK5_THACB|nr:hypothetical protein BN14_06133 [Rhizoctonia solani AG-1 IB]